MDFYKHIAHQLYCNNYKIGDTDFYTPANFIEAKQTEAKHKGKIFYLNLIKAMPVIGDRIARPELGETPTYKEKIFKETLEYCKAKIEEIKITDSPEMQSPEKIKWLGSPEQFGFVFGELAAKGYIELPTKETEGRFSKLAELLTLSFEVHSTKGKTKGKQTTKENLQRALSPETNSLSTKGKATLKLPPLKDLK